MLRSPGTRHTPKARRIWERLGGTSTSSSADYRSVARRRYPLRTRGGCSYKAGGAVLLPAGNPPAAVYPRVALEVLVQGLGGDILDLILLLQCRVQLEAAEVVGEIQHPAGCQTGHGHVQQLHMVALDIEHVIHTFGVGEGRRVDEDQVVLAPVLLQPFHHVILHQDRKSTRL